MKALDNIKKAAGRKIANFLLNIPEVREEFFDAAANYAEKAVECEESNIEHMVEEAIREARIDRQVEDGIEEALRDTEYKIEGMVKEEVEEAVSDAVNNVDTSVVEQVIAETFEVLIKRSGGPIRILVRQMIAIELSEKQKGTPS